MFFSLRPTLRHDILQVRVTASQSSRCSLGFMHLIVFWWLGVKGGAEGVHALLAFSAILTKPKCSAVCSEGGSELSQERKALRIELHVGREIMLPKEWMNCIGQESWKQKSTFWVPQRLRQSSRNFFDLPCWVAVASHCLAWEAIQSYHTKWTTFMFKQHIHAQFTWNTKAWVH